MVPRIMCNRISILVSRINGRQTLIEVFAINEVQGAEQNVMIANNIVKALWHHQSKKE